MTVKFMQSLLVYELVYVILIVALLNCLCTVFADEAGSLCIQGTVDVTVEDDSFMLLCEAMTRVCILLTYCCKSNV